MNEIGWAYSIFIIYEYSIERNPKHVLGVRIGLIFISHSRVWVPSWERLQKSSVNSKKENQTRFLAERLDGVWETRGFAFTAEYGVLGDQGLVVNRSDGTAADSTADPEQTNSRTINWLNTVLICLYIRHYIFPLIII